MLDPTDSFYVESAREMYELSHFITPLFNYSDWLDKPALPFLLIIACYKLFGVSAWAARLPSAICGTALVIFTYYSASKFLSRRAAIMAALILSSSPLFLIVGHVALTDEPLSFFYGAAMLTLAECLLLKKPNGQFIPIIFLSLAILCKGPVALVLAFGTLALFLILTSNSVEQIKEKVMRINPLSGLFLLICLSLPYYLLAHATTNGAFTHDFFFRQNIGRFEGTVNHQEPFWWYVPIFLGGYFPWTLYLITSGPWLDKIWRTRKHGTLRQSFLVYCFTWLIFVLSLFTFIPTKLPTYIVPISPALSIIIAAYLDTILSTSNSKPLLGPALFLLIACLAACIGAPLLPDLIGASLPFLNLTSCICGLLLCCTVLHTVLILRNKKQQAISVLFAAIYAGAISLIPLSFCMFYQTHQSSLDKLISTAKQNNAKLATLFSSIPSATFQYKEPIENINSLAELEQFCKRTKALHLLLATKIA